MAFPVLEFPGRADALWSYAILGLDHPVALAAPVIRIDGSDVVLSASRLGAGESTTPLTLPNGVVERRWTAPVDGRPDLALTFVARLADDSPFVRFRYELRPSAPVRLTNDDAGRNALAYLRLSFAMFPEVAEVRLSTFLYTLHSFTLEESPVPAADFAAGVAHMGPILAGTDGTHSLLVAYEHGSHTGNRFLEFRLAPDRSATLSAVKGNYFHGRALTPDAPFESLWFQLGVASGGLDALAAAYRNFVLHRFATHPASRAPHIYYNTWNHQERVKHLQRRTYLGDMTPERILAEIDIAHRMGVDVFVIDTGWYSKAGDWTVDAQRFPDGLAAIRSALAERGMQLGLWFNPIIADVSGSMHAAHLDCVQEWAGQPHALQAPWEGGSSQAVCVVSRYADAYADVLLRLIRETGVTYFKWDAVHQEYDHLSCDAPGHNHGGSDNSPQERNACYGFEQPAALVRIIERVQAAHPEAIFDLDVTEPGRTVGLAFLSVGKFFLLNNGPYFRDFDLPRNFDGNNNLFFYPGPARAWIFRSTLGYDRWLPSTLFLAHYFPDGPAESLRINVASMLLGHNGVWGDLLSLSPDEVTEFGRIVALYKQVRDAVTTAQPIRLGPVAGDPEVHEKIGADGRGLVALFASRTSTYDYVTRATAVATPFLATPDTELVALLPDGRAHLRVSFSRPGARLVFFGASPTP